MLGGDELKQMDEFNEVIQNQDTVKLDKKKSLKSGIDLILTLVMAIVIDILIVCCAECILLDQIVAMGLFVVLFLVLIVGRNAQSYLNN